MLKRFNLRRFSGVARATWEQTGLLANAITQARRACRVLVPRAARTQAAGGRAASVLALRAVLATAAITFSAASVAQETTRPFAAPSTMTSAPSSGIASLGQVTLALGLVLAVIFVAAWALRRVKGFGHKASGALEIIADLPVGQKERAVLVRVGNQQVLLGVAPGRVNTLHVLTEPVSLAPPASPISATGSPERPNFKSLLMKSLGK